VGGHGPVGGAGLKGEDAEEQEGEYAPEGSSDARCEQRAAGTMAVKV